MTKVIDTDLGYKKFMAGINILKKKPYVKVGLMADKPHKNADITVAEVGTIHEFGAPNANIPERSFMRSTYEEKKSNWLEETKDLAKKIADGKENISHSLDILGQIIQKDIKTKIKSGEFVPLKPKTIKRKKSDKPLIDTAQMLNSIRHKKVR